MVDARINVVMFAPNKMQKIGIDIKTIIHKKENFKLEKHQPIPTLRPGTKILKLLSDFTSQKMLKLSSTMSTKNPPNPSWEKDGSTTTIKL